MLLLIELYRINPSGDPKRERLYPAIYQPKRMCYFEHKGISPGADSAVGLLRWYLSTSDGMCICAQVWHHKVTKKFHVPGRVLPE